jgi:thymidylate synthase (FAD)
MKIVPCEVNLKKIDGTELDIVNAARVSFHKTSDELGDKDIKLINYLASHGHWTPMAHVGATFVIKAPLFVARQLGKSTVGLVWNEVSRRYVDEEPEFFFPDEWRGRPVNAKQGSDGVVVVSNQYVIEAQKSQLWLYEELLSLGVAPEQARMVLPQNMMTEWWWTGSLAAWARVFNLRLDPHTQKETQDVCRSMYELLLPSFPNALPALLKE